MLEKITSLPVIGYVIAGVIAVLATIFYFVFQQGVESEKAKQETATLKKSEKIRNRAATAKKLSREFRQKRGWER